MYSSKKYSKGKALLAFYVQGSWIVLKWDELYLPPNSYTDVIIPNNSECDLFGDKVFKLKGSHFGGPEYNMTGVPIRRD